MIIKRFEDILAWQKAKNQCINMYKCFDKTSDYGFKDQILRASVSVLNNIAEGFERKSDKEFCHFLHIAKGSCGEVRSMLYLAKDLGKISSDDAEKLLAESEEVSRIIFGLIKSMNPKKLD